MSTDEDTDPVASGLPDEDLYDVADWEQRGTLDAVAATLYGVIRAGGAGLLVLVAAVLLVGQAGVIGYAVLTEPSIGVLTLLSVVPAVLLVAFVWYQDATMREPWKPMAVTFLLAVLFASFAAVVNTALRPVFGAIPVVGVVVYFFLVVAPVEEFVKWLAVRVYAFRTAAFDAVIDGAVYGAVAGLGFATIENALYVTQGALQAGAITSPAAFTAAVGTATSRAFVGPGHVIYSAFAGYYLGLAKYNPEDKGPIVVKGLLVAVFIHAAYNSLVGVVPGLVTDALGLPSFVGLLLFILVYDGVFGYALYRKLARYREHYHRATRTERERGTAEPADA
jgi:RsiW-degrading membrane proteinase PrsW (M82 family)